MKVLVPVKRVVDYNVKIRVKADGSGVELANVKMSMNPFDEIAVEEAIRLSEKGKATEIVAVSIGPQQAQETLRTALAMGADRAILVKIDRDVEPLAVAKILKSVVEQESPELVILGKQAIDDDCNQTGQMLAALLGWPQGTFASKIEIGDGTIDVTREVDGGLQTVTLKLPAIVTTDLRLNEPRYASLPNIMKAKKKPLDETSPETLGVDVDAASQGAQDRRAAGRKAGVKVGSVAELVAEAEERSGSALMAVLLLAEHDNASAQGRDPQGADRRRRRIGGAARTSSSPGQDCKAVADAAAKLDGVEKVLLAEERRLCERARRAARGADRLARRALRRDRRGGDDDRQERDAARRRPARRDAGLRHHQGRLARHLRAADLCRQRDPDRRRPATARTVITVRTASFQAAADGGGRPGRGRRRRPTIRPCRPSRARRSPSPTVPN